MVVKANPQDTVVGHSAGRNYLKKDCIDVIRCLTEKRLNCFMAAFHAGQELPVVCDPDLFVCEYVCTEMGCRK